jgi:hypothetical protein
MDTRADCPIIILSSGQSLSITEIRLFGFDEVQSILKLRAERAKLMSSSGLTVGFAGSPEWVAGGAIVAGVLQSFAASGAIKQAGELQSKITKEEAELDKSGRFFRFQEVVGITEPNPLSWLASEKTVIRERRKIAPGRHNSYMNRLMEIEVDQETEREVVKAYITKPDDFMRVKSNVGIIDFRWSQVVAYRPAQSEA